MEAIEVKLRKKDEVSTRLVHEHQEMILGKRSGEVSTSTPRSSPSRWVGP